MQNNDLQNQEISYKDRLIDSILPFVESLLEKYGEFFPVAAAVLKDGNIATVATYDGNEQPLSNDVIESLKNALRAGAADREYLAGVIFYDVRVINPFSGEKTDAIVAHFEGIDDPVAIKYFYLYILTEENKLSFSEGWNNTVDKESFV
jgi:hypothetical protein